MLYAWAREYPDAVIYLYGLFPMRAKHFVFMMAMVELLLSYTPSPVARFAHLGGLVTGWLYFRTPDLGERFRNLVRVKIRWERPEDLGSEVDRILEKISRQGLASLTPQERAVLKRASRKKK
jgi:hypothetical protein